MDEHKALSIKPYYNFVKLEEVLVLTVSDRHGVIHCFLTSVASNKAFSLHKQTLFNPV